MLALFLLLALLLVLVGHAFRLLRWEQFIRIYERPPRGQMLRGMAGGYALNFVLPFHLGDAFRAVYTGRRMKSGIGFALATVIMDRFLDVWFVAFGFIAFRLLGLGGAPVDGAARYYLVFSLVLALGLVLVVALRDLLKKGCLAFCGLFNDTLKLDGMMFFWSLINTFKDLGRVKIGRLVVNTLVMWAAYLGSYGALAAALMMFALCACSGGSGSGDSDSGDKELTAQEILSKTQESIKNVQSASFEGELAMKMSLNGQDTDMSLKFNGENIVTPEPKVKMNIAVDYLGESQSMEMYLMQKDKKYVMYMNDGKKWTASEVASEDEIKQIQDAASNTAILDTMSAASDLTKEEEEEVDGAKCYVLSMKITADALSKAMSSANVTGATDSLEGMFSGMGDIPVKLWVNREDCTPAKIEIQMTDALHNVITSQLGENASSVEINVDKFSMDIKYTGFNDVKDITLPKEAESVTPVPADAGSASADASAAA